MNKAYRFSLSNYFLIKLNPRFSMLFKQSISAHVISEFASKDPLALLRSDVANRHRNTVQNAMGLPKQADQKGLGSFIRIELVEWLPYEKLAYFAVPGREACEVRQHESCYLYITRKLYQFPSFAN